MIKYFQVYVDYRYENEWVTSHLENMENLKIDLEIDFHLKCVSHGSQTHLFTHSTLGSTHRMYR